jgi:hypothetical protein
MFSRAAAVRDADGRTREAKIIKQTVADLVEHVGGHPTAAERLLIDATAVLVLRLRCALDRYATGVGDCESLDRHVVALQNGLRANLLAWACGVRSWSPAWVRSRSPTPGSLRRDPGRPGALASPRSSPRCHPGRPTARPSPEPGHLAG